MTCAACVYSVEEQLRTLPGVEHVAVSLSTSHGYVEYNASEIGPRDVLKCVEVC